MPSGIGCRCSDHNLIMMVRRRSTAPPPKPLAQLYCNDWLLYVIRVEEVAHGDFTDGSGTKPPKNPAEIALSVQNSMSINGQAARCPRDQLTKN
jgi:hypothetical protein